MPDKTPPLIKAARSHVQFETIRPFFDGKGSVGRLLITLLLCAENAVAEPTLYLSLYFKRHREFYYGLLQKVRMTGAWEEWLLFFLEGVEITAEEAVGTAARIMGIFAEDCARIENLGRAAGNALRVHSLLQRKLVVSVLAAASELNLSAPTIRSAIENLENLGLMRETTGKQRDRLFIYSRYLNILQEDTAETF